MTRDPEHIFSVGRASSERHKTQIQQSVCGFNGSEQVREKQLKTSNTTSKPSGTGSFPKEKFKLKQRRRFASVVNRTNVEKNVTFRFSFVTPNVHVRSEVQIFSFRKFLKSSDWNKLKLWVPTAVKRFIVNQLQRNKHVPFKTTKLEPEHICSKSIKSRVVTQRSERTRDILEKYFIRVRAWWRHVGFRQSHDDCLTSWDASRPSPTKYLKLLQTSFSPVTISISDIWSYLLNIKILSDINNLILTRQNRFLKIS